MRGLTLLPSANELSRAYDKLQFSKEPRPVVELVELVQWSRLDPRLAEILVRHIFTYWRQIPAALLNQQIICAPWPCVLGVILENVNTLVAKQIPKDKIIYKMWQRTATHALVPQAPQQFFVGQVSVGSKLMLDNIQFSLKNHIKWGYWEREPLVPTKDKRPSTQTLLDKKTRLYLLQKFLKLHRRFVVNDYIQFLGGNISRRLAELDLKKNTRIKKNGNTRGSVYYFR